LKHHARDLPQRLKTATLGWHARAERSGVMAALLARTIDRAAYIALLANLRAIYQTLDPLLDPVLDRALARGAAIDADLRAFGDAVPVPVSSTLDYVQRLRSLHGPEAHRVWAHVYVRSLGDLHGGQILGRLVREHFALDGGDGTRFYDFGDETRVRGLRAALRAQLASLPLRAAQADEVVAEAVWAFEAHCRLFEQIEAATG
jgi:heme oxygenase (biliverdin-producing, ferredoxin)